MKITADEIREMIRTNLGVNAQYYEEEAFNELKCYSYWERDEDGIKRIHGYILEDLEKYNSRLNPSTAKVGDGATICLWSDREACTIIKVTKSTVTVRRDKATLDPSFKPEWIAGGFSAICTNQEQQKWNYEPNENGAVTTFHWSKKYNTYGTPGNCKLIAGRHEHYDYNF